MTDFEVVDENGNVTENALLAKEILDIYAKTFQERNPNLYLFNAVLHMDEATPHLHLDYIPVAHNYKTGMKTRNSLTMMILVYLVQASCNTRTLVPQLSGQWFC